MEFNFKRRIPNGLVSFEFCYTLNEESPYKRSLHIENLEFCRLLKENSTNPFFEKAMSTYQFINSNSSYACNSTGLLKFYNLTFNDAPIFTIYPPGFHLFFTRFFDQNDSNILNVTIWAILNK
ncbi:hypothetical protein PVAND_016475 [Polypedilum vanderplanki]|uniref:Uncharacterized protein n=1 Tax=Polypedilum vanderplanki TaxID=319348 RepID=A0A9J6BF69_POLVA|nr:hypothetical protein PVAND_016475 [Polypedilum vanderplanki]